MAGRDSSFGFAGRVLLLAVVAAIVAVVAVSIYSAREAPLVKRGELGPITGNSPDRDSPSPALQSR